jgi:hypothetical protein
MRDFMVEDDLEPAEEVRRGGKVQRLEDDHAFTVGAEILHGHRAGHRGKRSGREGGGFLRRVNEAAAFAADELELPRAHRWLV